MSPEFWQPLSASTLPLRLPIRNPAPGRVIGSEESRSPCSGLEDQGLSEIIRRRRRGSEDATRRAPRVAFVPAPDPVWHRPLSREVGARRPGMLRACPSPRLSPSVCAQPDCVCRDHGSKRLFASGDLEERFRLPGSGCPGSLRWSPRLVVPLERVDFTFNVPDGQRLRLSQRRSR